MSADSTPTGAASHPAVDWHGIDWARVHSNVRRLQARIVKAARAGKTKDTGTIAGIVLFLIGGPLITWYLVQNSS